jgi:hypothetical protein
MAININELFVTDLDPNSGAWWSEAKLDKINYNFNQFSNGGMPGPQGTIGVDGGFGPDGAQGFTGYQGTQGTQGYQGPASLNDWEYFPEGKGLPGYLSPKKNPVNSNQEAPVAIRIGYKSIDTAEYLVGAAQGEPVQIVKTETGWSNLRVEDNGNIDGYNFMFDCGCEEQRLKISSNTGSNNSRIVFAAQNIVLRTLASTNPITLNDSIKITGNSININTRNNSNKFYLSEGGVGDIKSEQAFYFTPEAEIGKILISENNDGDVKWKNVKEVFGTFPIGSIITLDAKEFNDTHFEVSSINTPVASGYPVNFAYGRGKIGTEYEGWYLCHGETWETVEGYNRYLTPNLIGFRYQIIKNDAGQSAIDTYNVSLTQRTRPIIGGYDIDMFADVDTDGLYSISYNNSFLENNTSPGINKVTVNNVDSASTTPSYIRGNYFNKLNYWIVYLEDPNLKWSNTTITSTAPTINTDTFELFSTQNQSEICSSIGTTRLYFWNGPSLNVAWNTFDITDIRIKLFRNGTTLYAAAGWYRNTDGIGYPIYWNGSKFTLRGTTCTSISAGDTPNLSFSLTVSDLNGLGAIGEDYNGTPAPYIIFDGNNNYDPEFIDAVSIKTASGLNADAGWYRDMRSIPFARRYWNGAAFEGESFEYGSDYVSLVTFVENPGPSSTIESPGYNASSIGTVCQAARTKLLTYIVGNTQWDNTSDISFNVPGYPVNTYVSKTDKVRDYGLNIGQHSSLYVPVPALTYPTIDQETGYPPYTPPLKNIKDTYVVGSTTIKYDKVYMTPNNYDYGIINSTGSISRGATSSVVTMSCL